MQSKVFIKLAAVIGILVFFASSISYLFVSRQLTCILTSEIKKELQIAAAGLPPARLLL